MAVSWTQEVAVQRGLQHPIQLSIKNVIYIYVIIYNNYFLPFYWGFYVLCTSICGRKEV